MLDIRIKLDKFLALTGSEKRLLLSAMFWLPFFWLGLHFLSLNRCRRLLLQNTEVKNTSSQAEVNRIAELVNIAARRMFIPSTCLTRSLLLNWLLQRRGVDSKLRIGVRINQGELDAHAWVEYLGVPVNDRPDVVDRFASFPEQLPRRVEWIS